MFVTIGLIILAIIALVVILVSYHKYHNEGQLRWYLTLIHLWSVALIILVGLILLNIGGS